MLILASASPRRRELLTQAGIKFTVEAANLNEDLLPNEAAAAYVQRLAEEKAQAIWNARTSSDTLDDPLIVLGADTCVVCDGQVLGKPAGTADARRMLELLRGRTHAVLTGLAIITAARIVRGVEVTQVTFNQTEDAEIDHGTSPAANHWIRPERMPSRVMPRAGFLGLKGVTST